MIEAAKIFDNLTQLEREYAILEAYFTALGTLTRSYIEALKTEKFGICTYTTDQYIKSQFPEVKAGFSEVINGSESMLKVVGERMKILKGVIEGARVYLSDQGYSEN